MLTNSSFLQTTVIPSGFMYVMTLVVSHEANKKMEKQQRLLYTIKTVIILLEMYDTVNCSFSLPCMLPFPDSNFCCRLHYSLDSIKKLCDSFLI